MLKFNRTIKKGFSLRFGGMTARIIFDSYNTETGATFCIDAPPEVEICRDELTYDDIKKGNFSNPKSRNSTLNKPSIRTIRKKENFNE